MSWPQAVVTSVGIIVLGAVQWHAISQHVDGAEYVLFAAFLAGALGVILPIRSPFERGPGP